MPKRPLASFEMAAGRQRSQVAIKLIKHVPNDAAFMLRLAREVAIMRILDHPNVVRLVEVVTTDEHTAIVMPFVEGESLDECVFEGHDGRLPTHVARYLFRQVGGGGPCAVCVAHGGC